MPVYFLRNENGKLIPSGDSAATEYTRGWWNSIIGADFDNDGDIDYVVGNFGLNTRIKATLQKPATVYFKIFTATNHLMPITGNNFINGKSYPFAQPVALTTKCRILKRRWSRFSTTPAQP